jgi:hypothetical protein
MECLDEFSAGSWEFSKEELNSVDNLLLEIFVVDSESCVSSRSTRCEDAFDFGLHFIIINTLDFIVMKFLFNMRSGVLVMWGIMTIVFHWIRFKESLRFKSFIPWNDWLSWKICEGICLLIVVWSITWK